MDFMEAVAVLITRILAVSMANRLMAISPLGQPGIDIVFIGINRRTWGEHCGDDWLNGVLLNIGQHAQDNLSATLD
jgi:hypothetical protein